MTDIHNKIQHLLELANNNPSEDEAANAMNMARKLMMKYNIQLRDLGTVSSVSYGEAHTLDRDYFKILGHAVKIMTGVTMVYFADDTFKMAGTKVNVQIAHQLLMFLAEQVESLYKIYLPKGMSKRERAQYRKDFKRACALRIKQRCDQARFHDNPVTSRELVVIQNELEKEVEAFLQKQLVRVVKSRTQLKLHTKDGLDGLMAGDSAALQPRVNGG